MKKVLFAADVFFIIALSVFYPVPDAGHGIDKPAATYCYHAVTVEKTLAIQQGSEQINELTTFTLSVKLMAAFLKFPL